MTVGKQYCSVCGKEKEQVHIKYAGIDAFIECECEKNLRQQKEKADKEYAVKTAIEKFGRIDGLVNVAGVAPDVRADLLDMTEESYEKVMGINTKGTLFSCTHSIHPANWAYLSAPSIFNFYFCTKCSKTLDMLVNGTGSEITAAGQGHMGLVEAAQQRAHQIIAGAHLLHQIVIGTGAGDAGTIDLHHIRFGVFNFGAHAFQNVQQDAGIGNIGDIFDPAYAFYQKRCGQYGNGRIFRAADCNGTM